MQNLKESIGMFSELGMSGFESAKQLGEINLTAWEKMLDRLEDCWQASGIEVSPERIDLHYLGGAVDVEVLLPLDTVEGIEGARRLAQQLLESAGRDEYVGKVSVQFV